MNMQRRESLERESSRAAYEAAERNNKEDLGLEAKTKKTGDAESSKKNPEAKEKAQTWKRTRRTKTI